MPKIMFHLNCLEQGGAERVVTNLASQFYRDGYEVIIATEWQAKNEFTIEAGIRRLHVGLSKEDEVKSRIKQNFIRIINLRRAILKEKPDAVIAFARKANYRALMSSRFTRIPVIISVRTNPVGHYDALSDKVVTALLFPKAAGCVFQTPGARDFFSKEIRKKSRVILNPIHEKYIGREIPKVRTKEIVHVGRLVDFKNQAMLIKGFSTVHKKYPEYTLKLFGGDSHDGTKEILEDIIQREGLHECVKLAGANDNLHNEIENAAFFAFTSDWEGLPNAVMEAMALGLPVISTDCPCGGPASVIKYNENGLLIPIKDQSALEYAMIWMIEHPELAEKMGFEARKIGLIANTESIYNQWKKYVEEICK